MEPVAIAIAAGAAYLASRPAAAPDPAPEPPPPPARRTRTTRTRPSDPTGVSIDLDDLDDLVEIDVDAPDLPEIPSWIRDAGKAVVWVKLYNDVLKWKTGGEFDGFNGIASWFGQDKLSQIRRAERKRSSQMREAQANTAAAVANWIRENQAVSLRMMVRLYQVGGFSPFIDTLRMWRRLAPDVEWLQLEDAFTYITGDLAPPPSSAWAGLTAEQAAATAWTDIVDADLVIIQ